MCSSWCKRLQGRDWNSQIKLGNGGFYGMSVMPACVCCSNLMWLGHSLSVHYRNATAISGPCESPASHCFTWLEQSIFACTFCTGMSFSSTSSDSGFNYLQSVTPKLALGGETFYLSQAMKSGVGFAARHQGDQHVATAQIATTGLISLNYAHKLSEKVRCCVREAWAGSNTALPVGHATYNTSDVARLWLLLCYSSVHHLKHRSRCSLCCQRQLAYSVVYMLLQVTLASDFMWNWNQREPSASFGYDYMLRQCRLRGKIDTDGKVGAYLEERVNVGVNFILSAELDHPKKDYKFGFGMTVGE